MLIRSFTQSAWTSPSRNRPSLQSRQRRQVEPQATTRRTVDPVAAAIAPPARRAPSQRRSASAAAPLRCGTGAERSTAHRARGARLVSQCWAEGKPRWPRHIVERIAGLPPRPTLCHRRRCCRGGARLACRRSGRGKCAGRAYQVRRTPRTLATGRQNPSALPVYPLVLQVVVRQNGSQIRAGPVCAAWAAATR